MLELASKLIEQKVTSFEPKNYEDRYEVALLEMIRGKLKGQTPVFAAAPERGNIINLMDALKASLGQTKPAAPSKSKVKTAPAEQEEETAAAPAKGKTAKGKAAAAEKPVPASKAAPAKTAAAPKAPPKRKSA